MDGSKESDLVIAVLMYAVRCLAECDLAALRSMNFGPVTAGVNPHLFAAGPHEK